MKRRAAIALAGLILGALGAVLGCTIAAGVNDIPAVLDDALRAACVRQLGSCGTKRVWYNRCTGQIEVYDADGMLRKRLQAWEIGEIAGESEERRRPGVEQQSSASGAHGDAPKLTRAWRCKKRGERMYCHLYHGADSAFGAFVKEWYVPLTQQMESRRWCTAAGGCAPMLREL